MAAAAAAGCQTSCRRQTTRTNGGWTSPDHRAEVRMKSLHHSQPGPKAGKPHMISEASRKHADATRSMFQNMYLFVGPSRFAGMAMAGPSWAELSTL